jgi:hypothetical protein
MYHARIPGVASKSALVEVAKAPAKYEAWLSGTLPERKGAALDLGKALHCALLEPDLFATHYLVKPDFGDGRFKAAKAAKAAWEEENDARGKVILCSADAVAVEGMVRSVHAHPKAGRLLDLSEGSAELTMRWTDPATGIICKGRADRHIARVGACVDVKTCDDASDDAFTRSIESFGYQNQNAFYENGFAAVGAPLACFAFVAVEKEPPYLVNVFLLDDEWRADGRAWATEQLATLAECLERGSYPGYDTSIRTLSRPAWARRKRT